MPLLWSLTAVRRKIFQGNPRTPETVYKTSTGGRGHTSVYAAISHSLSPRRDSSKRWLGLLHYDVYRALASGCIPFLPATE